MPCSSLQWTPPLWAKWLVLSWSPALPLMEGISPVESAPAVCDAACPHWRALGQPWTTHTSTSHP